MWDIASKIRQNTAGVQDARRALELSTILESVLACSILSTQEDLDATDLFLAHETLNATRSLAESFLKETSKKKLTL